jgi:tRNA threonylcarbamoyladenosine biosynthesis protein TsaE
LVHALLLDRRTRIKTKSMNDMIAIALASEEETDALGRRLACLLRPGEVVALGGDLGAGKTALARALIRAWLDQPEEEVPSPTFTLVQTYEGERGEIWHFDLYRLERPEDAQELGFEEALGRALLLIEWPDRLGPLLPRKRIEVSLAVTGLSSRQAMISGLGLRVGELEH